jgi:hypothetical protein
MVEEKICRRPAARRLRLIVEDVGELIGWVVAEVLLFLATRETGKETGTAERRVLALERLLFGLPGRSLGVGRLLRWFGAVEFEKAAFHLTVAVRRFEPEDDPGVISVSISVEHDAVDGTLLWSLCRSAFEDGDLECESSAWGCANGALLDFFSDRYPAEDAGDGR